MLDGAVVVPIQEMFYNILFELAAILWIMNRALLIVGYFLMAMTGWITEQVFAPLLTIVGDQTGQLIGPIFSIAMGVLAMTYILAVFGRFHVVSMRRAVMWLLFAGALYTFGPNFYLGMETFRREIAAAFYEVGVSSATGGGTVTGLSAVGSSPEDAMTVPTDQLGVFLPLTTVTYVDGVDVALAYLNADGYDLLGNTGAHSIGRLPWNWIEDGNGGYFDPSTGPTTFSSVNADARSASLAMAAQGVSRSFTAILISILAVVEQIIHFLLACAFAIAFISMFVATLFAFFIRTEPIAGAALEMVIELFIQTLINSLLISLITGFVLIAANTGNGILLLGGSIAALFMAWNLMQGTLKGLTNSTDRLYHSFAAATGGSFATAGETRASIGEAAATAGTAAMGAVTGAAVLAGGGSFVQAAGSALGDSRTAQTMNYASRMLGGDDTFMGRAADAFGQGAAARSIGGPVGGALLGVDTRRRRQDEEAREARLSYLGDADEDRDEAVHDYRRSFERDRLSWSFHEADVPRVQALSMAYGNDEFDAVTDAVRRTRNANPGLPPASPAFQNQVRGQLPENLQDIDSAALADFASIFGDTAESGASDYEKATAIFEPIPTPGPLDEARDNAVSAYRGSGAETDLTDAFSTDDANRVARLMDSYSEDDFDEVVSAVRSTRDNDPDMQPGSRQALSAARNALSPGLQMMPTADLQAFSNAFGTAATAGAVSDNARPEPEIYTGNRDERLDRAMLAYRKTGDDRALDEVFDPGRANEVMTMADTYSSDDFDAAVRAVRQARTDDPDLHPGSNLAVRAARANLPDRMRQMSRRDLEVLSEAFGGDANPPAAPPAGARVPVPSRRRERNEERPFNRAAATADMEQKYGDDFDTLANTARAVHVADATLYPGSGEAVAAMRAQLPPRFDDAPAEDLRQMSLAYNDDLKTVPGIGPIEQVRLRQAGVETVEQLATVNPSDLSEKAGVAPVRASMMVAEARDVARIPAPAPDIRQAKGQMQRALGENQAISVKVTLDLSSINGVGPSLQSKLGQAGINSVADLAGASPAALGAIKGISEKRAATLIREAQSRVSAGSISVPPPAPASSGGGTAIPVSRPTPPMGSRPSRRRHEGEGSPPRDDNNLVAPPPNDMRSSSPHSSGRRSNVPSRTGSTGGRQVSSPTPVERGGPPPPSDVSTAAPTPPSRNVRRSAPAGSGARVSASSASSTPVTTPRSGSTSTPPPSHNSGSADLARSGTRVPTSGASPTTPPSSRSSDAASTPPPRNAGRATSAPSRPETTTPPPNRSRGGARPAPSARRQIPTSDETMRDTPLPPSRGRQSTPPLPDEGENPLAGANQLRQREEDDS